jgi:hypothetical protein
MLITGAGTFAVTTFRSSRLLAAALLAYLMAAFWLTPTFVSTMAFNWPKDAYEYRFQTSQIWMLAGLPLGAIVIRLLFARAPQSIWFCFLAICSFGFSWVVVGFYRFGYNTLPESRRYEMEFELFAILVGMEIVRQAIQHRWILAQAAGLILLATACILGADQIRRYAATAYQPLHPIPSGQTAEVRTVEALSGLRPEGRVAVSGGTRYRMHSLPSPNSAAHLSRDWLIAAPPISYIECAHRPAAYTVKRAATRHGCSPRWACNTLQFTPKTRRNIFGTSAFQKSLRVFCRECTTTAATAFIMFLTPA